MGNEQLKQENETLRKAIENTLQNLMGYRDDWEDLNFLRRSALTRTINKLKFALDDEEAIKRVEAHREYMKRLGEA